MTFTQPICESCYFAWSLGHFGEPRQAARLTDEVEADPCCICKKPTRIYFRVDPRLVPFPKEEE